MSNKRKAKKRLKRATKFSAVITAGTVGIGAGISVPVYLKTEKELNSAIDEASNVTLGVNELTKQLGFAAGQDNISKYIKGGYRVDYANGITKIFKAESETKTGELVLTIDKAGKITTKFPMSGTAAKTIISIILLVKNHLFNEMNAEKDILVPFLHDMIRAKMHVDGSTPLISKAREGAAAAFASGSPLVEKIKNAKEPNDLKSSRLSIMDAVVNFWQGFGFQKESVKESFDKWNKDPKNEKYFDEILGSTSKYQLSEVLKYQGYTMEELLKYFKVSQLTYDEIIKEMNTQENELKNLLASFEKDKNSENIFRKISTNYGNTFVALSKTFGLEQKDKTIAASDSIRGKLLKFLRDEHSLPTKAQDFMINEIKKMINLKKTDTGEIGQVEITASNQRRIVIGDEVYTIQEVYSVPQDSSSKSEQKCILFKKKVDESKLWNGEISFITKKQQKQLIALIDQTSIRNIDTTKNSESYKKIMDYICNGNQSDSEVDSLLENIDKSIYWQVFENGLKSNDIMNSLRVAWRKLNSYPEKIRKIIDNYSGSTDGFDYKYLDEISKKIFIDPLNKYPGPVVLDFALNGVTDTDEYHNRDNYERIILIAINQVISWNGWEWVEETFKGKSFDPAIRLLTASTIADFENEDLLINNVIDKIGRT